MDKNIKHLLGYTFIGLLSAAAVLPVFSIIGYIIIKGAARLDWEFISTVSISIESGGILSPIVGTIMLTFMTLVFAVPIGLAAAIYMSEYSRPGRLLQMIEISIINLAGIPSIVYGLFGLGVFVIFMQIGVSILAGALTMATLVLPLIISVSYQAFQSVPLYLREASLALGASRFQTTWRIVLPSALPGVLTGVILATARVAGETAPVLFTAAAYFIPGLPESLLDKTMLLSYHLFALSTQVTGVSEDQKYGVTLVLVVLVLMFNILSIILRTRLKEKLQNYQ